MEFKVLEVRQFKDMLLVIYDWMNFPLDSSISNLYAYDADGTRLWIAEERRMGDFYTSFVSVGKQLQVATWDGFCCTLAPETGKISESKFVK